MRDLQTFSDIRITVSNKRKPFIYAGLFLYAFPFCHIFSFWIIYIPAQQKDCTKIFREIILLENGLVSALPLAPERPKHTYRKSSIKSPPELIYFKPMLGGA